MAVMFRRSRFALVLLAIHLFQTAQSLNEACYHITDGIEKASYFGGPCGIVSPDSPFYSCCAIGDQCLENGLCHTPIPLQKPAHGSNITGYYVGGCNDALVKDPSCNPGCDQLKFQDVVWNRVEEEWLCCGAINQSIKCNNPTTQTVVAKALSLIATTYVVPSIVATTSASATADSTSSPSPTNSGSSSTTANSTSSPSPTNSNTNSNSSTPVGAIVGGVIGGLAAIVILTGGWFLWRRKKRAAELKAAETVETVEDHGRDISKPLSDPVSNGYVEKDPEVERIELQTKENPVELSSHSPLEDNRTRGVSELPTWEVR